MIAGTASTTEVTFDGATVAGLGSSTADLGTTPIGRVQIGENVAGRTADLSYDTVTVSGPGPDPTPTPTPTPSVFADGFESGSTSAWSAGTGLVVGTAPVADGSYAARANMTGSAAYVHRNLATATTEATTSVKVNLASISGTSAVNFLKIRTASGTALAEVFITPSGVLGLRNDVTGVAVNSTKVVSTGTWHTITLRAVIAGTASTTEVTFDGVTVAALGSSTADLGTTPIGRVQIGENVAGRTADLSYDTVTVSGPGSTPPPTPSGDPVLMAAGDIACDPLNSAYRGGAGTSNACQMNAVGQLVLADPSVTAVAALGDIQYECGGLAAFNASYDQTWGRFKAMTYPAVGNHEYIKSSTSPATDCDCHGKRGRLLPVLRCPSRTGRQGLLQL